MVGFLYRCPNTGSNVQGWLAGDATSNDRLQYEQLTCLACGRVHFVNPKTGHVLGEPNRK
jgi:hypothetical protein